VKHPIPQKKKKKKRKKKKEEARRTDVKIKISLKNQNLLKRIK
jgi:hypothetical protein